jgi:hypothetical protein
MTRVTRTVDLFCRAVNRNKLLAHAHDDEVEPRTEERDRALKRFRVAMSKITKEQYLNARWGAAPLHYRLKQWNELVAVSNDPPKWPKDI